MSASTPQNGNSFPNPPAPAPPYPASQMPNHAVVSVPSAIPLNPPSANSGIPMNAPRPVSPLPTAPGAYQPMPAGQTPYPQAMPAPQSPYAQQMPNPQSPYTQAPYAQPIPGSYTVPNSASGGQQSTYRPLSTPSEADGPNMGRGLLAGILLCLACGLGFGFISIAAGFRIPYLSLGIGYLIGYAVLYACGESGEKQGLIGGACSLLACLIGMGLMYMNGIYISPLAIVIVGFATYRGYDIAANN